MWGYKNGDTDRKQKINRKQGNRAASSGRNVGLRVVEGGRSVVFRLCGCGCRKDGLLRLGQRKRTRIKGQGGSGLRSGWLGLAIALSGIFVGGIAWRRAETLSEENALLRRHAAARERVQKWGQARASVDGNAVAFAAYNWGTPQSVLTAIRLQENGAPQWEMGHKGKTEFIAINTPISTWQYCESARTINKALWRWAWSDERRRRDAIKALGRAYTSEAHAKRWANNVEQLEKEIRNDLDSNR